MTESFVIRRRVEFADTDMAGMMHFSNYLRFMEQAEQDFVRSLGLTPMWTNEEGSFGFPRVSATCDYLRPAKFEDTLEVEICVAQLGQKSVTYSFEFRREGVTIARGRMSSVFCQVMPNGDVKSLPIPDEHRKKLGISCGAVQPD
jgi:acyl-CoA thioester hydrolase